MVREIMKIMMLRRRPRHVICAKLTGKQRA
jgi:hypothetical protein